MEDQDKQVQARNLTAWQGEGLVDMPPAWAPDEEPKTRGPRYWVWTLVGALVFIGIVACLVLLTAAGVSDGLEDRAREALRLSEEHYRLGLEHLEAQDYELAIAEFEVALHYNPTHQEAQRQLAAAEETARAQVTPTSEARQSAAAQLFQEARSLYEDGRWDAAVTELEKLRGLDPTYEATRVKDMLAEAYFRQGLSAVEKDDLARALNRFDKALDLEPGHEAAQEQVNLANLYIAAMSYWHQDWPATLQAFNGLYAMAPDYKDVPERLHDAHKLYGDALAEDGAWCVATSQYAAAAEILSRPETLSLLTQATEQCRLAMVTPTPVMESTATPSPGASGSLSGRGRIAFSVYDSQTQSHDLYELDVRSGVARLVLAGASQPSYGPLGQELAFYNHDPIRLGIGVVNVDGSDVRNVSAHVEDSSPVWSPEGERIVFASNKHGDRAWRVYAISPEAVHGEGEEWGFGRAPAWSPDGEQLVYQGCDNQGQNCGLWIMDRGGAARRGLTTTANDTLPVWHPDGTQIAFVSDRGGSWDLYVVQVSTGAVTQLTNDPAVDSAPAWSPDGRQLAFLSNRDEGRWSIYLLGLSTRQISRLAPASETYPDWMAQRLAWTR
jgi:Tol biopolymer transport system component/outer membrane protein assembly factor BamD (BamD/ComL family)